jgi:hypothetical protein
LAHTLLIERLTLQHDHITDQQEKTEVVITSIANAMREAALQTSGVKQMLDQFLLQGLPGITNEMKAVISNGIREVNDAAHRKGR